MNSSAIMVVNGTAPDECLLQMKKLSTNPDPKTIMGKNVADIIDVCFH
jgi:hypothetical protein